jgi:hypothetical protein
VTLLRYAIIVFGECNTHTTYFSPVWDVSMADFPDQFRSARKPRVFVSIPSSDLWSMRELAKNALLNTGCHPSMRQHCPDDARVVEVVSRGELTDCDAMIHIVGLRYGVEPKTRKKEQPRRSCAQIEYFAARDLGLPVYTFVCAEDFPYDWVEDQEPDELRDLQRVYRQQLIDEDESHCKLNGFQDFEKHILKLEIATHKVPGETNLTWEDRLNANSIGFDWDVDLLLSGRARSAVKAHGLDANQAIESCLDWYHYNKSETAREILVKFISNADEEHSCYLRCLEALAIKEEDIRYCVGAYLRARKWGSSSHCAYVKQRDAWLCDRLTEVCLWRFEAECLGFPDNDADLSLATSVQGDLEENPESSTSEKDRGDGSDGQAQRPDRMFSVVNARESNSGLDCLESSVAGADGDNASEIPFVDDTTRPVELDSDVGEIHHGEVATPGNTAVHDGRGSALNAPEQLTNATSPLESGESCKASMVGDSSEGDDVEVTVFAPPSTRAGDELFVQVYAHFPHEENEVRVSAMEIDPSSTRRGFTSLDTRVQVGSQFEFMLSLGNSAIPSQFERLIWRGRMAYAQFVFEIPATLDARALNGFLEVRQDGIVIGSIKFRIVVESDVTGQSPEPQPLGTASRYRMAFISYASKDRPQVLRRVQMLRAVGISFFQDIFDLVSGERWEEALYENIEKSDVMFLFWSQAAKGSRWVEREWRTGLERKGDKYICPVPIEGSPMPEPPAEFKHLHFGDPIHYFIQDGKCPKCLAKLATDEALMCRECGYSWFRCPCCQSEWVRGERVCLNCGQILDDLVCAAEPGSEV